MTGTRAGHASSKTFAPDHVPALVVVWDSDRGEQTSQIVRSAGSGVVSHVATFAFHAIRDESAGRSRFTGPPRGAFYTATGAHRIDDVLAQMWTCAEADALRAVPGGGARYLEPNLRIQEQADRAFRVMWRRFERTVGRVDSTPPQEPSGPGVER